MVNFFLGIGFLPSSLFLHRFLPAFEVVGGFLGGFGSGVFFFGWFPLGFACWGASVAVFLQRFPGNVLADGFRGDSLGGGTLVHLPLALFFLRGCFGALFHRCPVGVRVQGFPGMGRIPHRFSRAIRRFVREDLTLRRYSPFPQSLLRDRKYPLMPVKEYAPYNKTRNGPILFTSICLRKAINCCCDGRSPPPPTESVRP